MKLRRITIFLTVAKRLSYTKAARELYLSQPAVTKNIQEFEKELGARLFDRKGSDIELTAAGEIVVSYGSEIDQMMQNLTFELGLMKKDLVGNLRIGASSTISQYLIPQIIARFKESHPKASISLISGNTSEINNHLKNELIDLGITEGCKKLNNFEYTSFRTDEIAFISHQTSSYFSSEELTKDELADLPLVIRETGSGTREVFEKVLRKAGLTLSDLNIVVTLGSTESIKSYITHSNAVGVFSTNAIRKNERSLFNISQLKEYPIRRQYQFIVKQGSVHKLASKFIRFSI